MWLSAILGGSMTKSLLILSALIFVSTLAHAGDSWKTSTESDAQGRICVAYTSAKEGKNSFTLQVRVREGLSTMTELVLVQAGPALAAKGFQGRVGTNGPLLQVSALGVQGGTEYYFGLPHSTSAVITAMNSQKELDLDPVGGAGPQIDFTLKGFTAALQTLLQCASKPALASDEFEKALMGTTTLSVDLARITPTAAQALRKIANDAYLVFLQRKGNLQAMADLRKKYQAELDEYDRLQARIKQINGTELPQLAGKRAKLVTSLAQAQQELQDTQANLPKMQTRVNTAQAAYDKAYAVFEPLIPQHDSLENNVDVAQSSLNSSQNRLRQVESEIYQAEQRDRELRNKIIDLQNEIMRLNNQLPQARWDLRQAEQNLAAFNYQGEIDRYLQSHNYQGLKSQESTLASQQMSAQQEAAQARAELQSARQNLQQCKATQGADCSSQQAAFNTAQSQFQIASAKENQINSQLSNIRSQINEIERRARREADDKLDDLQDRKRDAANRVANIENGIRNNQNEISNIQNYQIPQNDSLIRTLQSERSQLQWTISSQQSSLNSAQNQLANYERQVDWVTKKRNVELTRSELRSAKNALEYAQERLADLPGEIASYKTQINNVDATVAQLNAELAQDQKAVQALQATVDKYEAEKAPLAAKDKSLLAQLNAFSKEYVTNLSL